jgi:hypothetical protein
MGASPQEYWEPSYDDYLDIDDSVRRWFNTASENIRVALKCL